MAKTKVVKAKVSKVKQPKRITKGVRNSWEVWTVDENGYYYIDMEYQTKNQAEKYIKDNPSLLAPVILHIDIPPMEY